MGFFLGGMYCLVQYVYLTKSIALGTRLKGTLGLGRDVLMSWSGAVREPLPMFWRT